MCGARVTVNRIAATVLLAALSVRADVPGGHWYVGFGASASKPLASDKSLVWNPSIPGERGEPLHADLALSLDLAFETAHAFAAISLEHGGLLQTQPEFDLQSLRGGVIFGSGNAALYVGLGAGRMSMTVFTPYDMGTMVHASGAALLAEAGVLLLRDRQFGRIALALRLIDPLFGMQGPPYTAGAQSSDRIPLLLFTTRLFL